MSTTSTTVWWAKDSIAFNNATTLVSTYTTTEGTTKVHVDRTAGAVSFKGLFGCAEAYKQCTSDSAANCVADASNCPVVNTPAALFQGQCPGSGSGVEAGWTFNVGGPASAMGVPEQVFKAGLISKKLVSAISAMCQLLHADKLPTQSRLDQHTIVWQVVQSIHFRHLLNKHK